MRRWHDVYAVRFPATDRVRPFAWIAHGVHLFRQILHRLAVDVPYLEWDSVHRFRLSDGNRFAVGLQVRLARAWRIARVGSNFHLLAKIGQRYQSDSRQVVTSSEIEWLWGMQLLV